MALWYTAKEGDQLDAICKEIYGYSRGSTEAVLAHESNRELAKKTPDLQAGDQVYLPDLPPQETGVKTLKLWS
ncbi:MAG: phage tail protein [Crocinitomicaceae bacterium]|nr:phage tail protein [Crocinitomicaceae bacterium]|tara:strand:- start:4478 stop:4696 length:219 start_codon:yes stop_codon:yes gene_type:complete